MPRYTRSADRKIIYPDSFSGEASSDTPAETPEGVTPVHAIPLPRRAADGALPLDFDEVMARAERADFALKATPGVWRGSVRTGRSMQEIMHELLESRFGPAQQASVDPPPSDTQE